MKNEMMPEEMKTAGREEIEEIGPGRSETGNPVWHLMKMTVEKKVTNIVRC